MLNRRTAALVILGAVLGLMTACSSSRLVQIPPRMDLRGYGTVGMIEFASNHEENLHEEASREFLTALQDAQPGVPVLELGSERQVLRSLPAEGLDPGTIRAIGEKYQVDVCLFGVLETKEAKPKVSIGSTMESLSASAEVEASLTAKLFDTRSGATLWSTSARGKETLGSLSVSPREGLPEVGVSHSDDALDRLVHSLVATATRDFRPSWVRERD
jgi:hypothetical protein